MREKNSLLLSIKAKSVSSLGIESAVCVCGVLILDFLLQIQWQRWSAFQLKHIWSELMLSSASLLQHNQCLERDNTFIREERKGKKGIDSSGNMGGDNSNIMDIERDRKDYGASHAWILQGGELTVTLF